MKLYVFTWIEILIQRVPKSLFDKPGPNVNSSAAPGQPLHSVIPPSVFVVACQSGGHPLGGDPTLVFQRPVSSTLSIRYHS